MNSVPSRQVLGQSQDFDPTEDATDLFLVFNRNEFMEQDNAIPRHMCDFQAMLTVCHEKGYTHEIISTYEFHDGELPFGAPIEIVILNDEGGQEAVLLIDSQDWRDDYNKACSCCV